MDLIVESASLALWGKDRFRCAVGRGGIISAAQKREGDGATPAGSWPMREVFYRADRMAAPITALPIRPLNPDDGWCEAPDAADYNRLVSYSSDPAHYGLWRDDHLYDVLVVLGYNDQPVVSGKGSAIFLHLARPDFSPSAGCVTLRQEDLLVVLRAADRGSCVEIKSSN